ncbi:hypothetical protein [Methylovulum miyakonense]|uniref:hypothetical protein n=1 Tax=Methylovulum miyakonense TaxID=645578 RepID=UPI00039D87B1|nr:hypothetical protein [Methylovulum miyakonense]
MQTLQISDQAANNLNDMARQEHLAPAELIEQLIEKHRNEQAKRRELQAFFKPYQKDMTGFTFDREEANAR